MVQHKLGLNQWEGLSKHLYGSDSPESMMLHAGPRLFSLANGVCQQVYSVPPYILPVDHVAKKTLEC